MNTDTNSIPHHNQNFAGPATIETTLDAPPPQPLSSFDLPATKPWTPKLAKATESNQKESHLYKTEHCRNWTELGTCRYGKKCRYAHGDTELRWIDRDSRYKTRICRAYHVEGTCLYGSRCTFIHNDTGRDVIGVDANKSLVQASSSGGFSVPKTRQRSRFFVSDINDGDLHHGLASSAPIATRSPTKTMWDPTLGLGMQPLLDHSTLGNQRHHPYTGNLTAPTASTDKYDRRPHLPSLASPLSLASSSSFCSSSFSSSTSSLSSIKTIGNHQASHLDSFGALDPMTVAILSVETKRSTSWNNYTTTTADSETNGNMVMGHIHD